MKKMFLLLILMVSMWFTASVFAHDIKIDATGLNTNGFEIRPVTGWLNPNTVQPLSLNEGTYWFYEQGTGASGDFQFTVDSDGKISYDPSLENYVSGSGTDTLTIEGYAITVDVTALDTVGFELIGSTPTLDPTTIHSLTLIPGTHGFYEKGTGYSGNFHFTMDSDGKISYDPSLENFVSGAGTDTLTVGGLTVTVDVTELTTNAFSIINSTGGMDPTLPQSVVLIPGTHNFFEWGTGWNGYFQFTLDSDGMISYDPSLENYVSGSGTSTLTVEGFAITVDVTALDTQGFELIGSTPTLDPTVIHSLTLIPGTHGFYEKGTGYTGDFQFTMDSDGKISYDPSLENFLSGQGTNTFIVDGLGVTIDPLGLFPDTANFYINGVSNWLATNTVHLFSLIPGNYRFNEGSTSFLFQIDSQGFFQGLPSEFLGVPVSGGGTSLLMFSVNRCPEVSTDANLTIFSQEQPYTIMHATALDPDGDEMTYQWFEETSSGDVLVVDTTPVVGGAADLNLVDLDPLIIGTNVFRVEVSDGLCTTSAVVSITVENSSPVAAPSGGGVYEISEGSDISLGGEVSDYDGNDLTYKWILMLEGDDEVLFSGSINSIYGGDAVLLPEVTLPTMSLGLGEYTIKLVVSDGINIGEGSIAVQVIDSNSPVLAPVASKAILWPPNHKMVEVSIWANASDNSGQPVGLAVRVESSEPPEYDGDGNFLPDHEILAVNSSTGMIYLNLRAERSGTGDGRTYAITITATDDSGNSSEAVVTIVAPHDKRK